MNNYNPYKEYPKIFLQSKLTCKKFFNTHRVTFQSYSYSAEDIEQDVNLALFSTIEKFKDKPEEDLRKLCSNLMFWKLCWILRVIKEKVHKENEAKNSGLNELQDFDEHSIIFDILKNKMNKKQYYIIYQIIVNNKKAIEIADELNISRQRVYQLYHSGLNRAKILMKI